MFHSVSNDFVVPSNIHISFVDPHFRTFDGTKYSYHGECDLVLTRGMHVLSGFPVDIHTRTTIVDGWSLISNAAIRIGSDILEVVNDGSFYFNGNKNVIDPILMSDRFNVSTHERTVEVNGEESSETEKIFVIDLGKDNDITVSIWKSMISVKANAYLKGAEGMLGIHGMAGLVGRDGSIVVEDPNQMGSAWQVRDTEPMLFHEIRAPQYPMECKLPKVQSRLRRLGENDILYQRAKEACADVDDDMKEFCIEDVMLIGDEHVAVGYSNRF